jgi:methyl-accepting chemotaxis protein
MVESARMQAQRVSEASSSTHEMAASVELIAQSVSGLTGLCERSRGEVATGLEGMQRTEQGLHRIESVNRVAKENSRALEVKTATIRRISSFIEEIAEQTHLLALNAAIEAARAGEHGAGFGVLAHELTKLANRSAESAHEIADLVVSIQNEAARADNELVESTVAVEEGLQLAKELRLSFSNIATAVADVSQHAQEIDRATRQQAAGSNQIAKASSHLEQLTQEIASAIEQQAASTKQAVGAMDALLGGSREVSSSSAELAVSAGQMSRMSQSLLQLMERFTLPDNRPVARNRTALPALDVAAGWGKALESDASSRQSRPANFLRGQAHS